MANDTHNLEKAKLGKKDEFYTRYEDIELELRNYDVDQLAGKTVFCNCDDPFVSQFYRYFILNFDRLGLKKLICSCYKEQEQNLFSTKPNQRAFYVEYNGGLIEEEALDPKKVGLHYFKGDGSFCSPESEHLLDKADIVVTNPPFSHFRKFVHLMDRKNKKFIIVGNVNAITYKECFKLFEQGRMWLGDSIHSGDREFAVPSSYLIDMEGAKLQDNGDTITKSGRIDALGNKYIRVKGVRWFTNMEFEGLHHPIELTKRYSKSEYPVFDNYPMAINVDKTSDIPCDYYGLMGVPITFLDRYDPNQFEIVGNEYTLGIKGGRGYVNGKRMYSRIFIRSKEMVVA